ncbi:MAG TPA: ATP-binding protein [Vicinamibacterales bacterium]|nr:ATP-binding protein [Vicinamibacterales bacterium]
MSRSTLLLFMLAAIIFALANVLAIAVLRFVAAVRRLSRSDRAGRETMLMADAVQDAVHRLRTEERAMKARAEESERLSSEIIGSMTSGVLVVDEQRLVRTLNPAGVHLLRGSDPAGAHLEPLGSDPRLRAVLAGAPALADAVEESLASGKPIVRRALRLEGSASTSHLGVTVSPIRSTGGALQGAICLFSDLSEVAELEEQLRLKDSLARLGELTAGIAHEFRNGLATIHGYARLLDLERLPDEYRPYVTGIRAETESLRQVVTQFLNFAKPAELVLARVDVRSLADRAADEIRGEARARGGSVNVRGQFGTVDGDEVLLRQAFSNLCRNALEACVGAGRVPEITIEGSTDPAQALLRVAVVDNGPGIDDRVASHMFQPFFTTKANGIGLGLALVQKIIVTHNGRVSASREPESGARVVVTLPLRESA